MGGHLRDAQFDAVARKVGQSGRGPGEGNVHQFRDGILLVSRELHGAALSTAAVTAARTMSLLSGLVTKPTAPAAIAKSRVEVCTSAVAITTRAVGSIER